MKKILFITFIIVLSFCLCGCTEITASDKSYPKPVVVLPDEDTYYSVNGYKNTGIGNTDETVSLAHAVEITFVGNKNSKKYHTPECTYAVNMKMENKIIFSDSTSPEEMGYSACSVCLKDVE